MSGGPSRTEPGDAAAIADLAGLLALAWAQPGRLLADALVEGDWAGGVRECLEAGGLPAGVPDALGVLAAAVAGRDADSLALDLAAEYAALFQGPGRALVHAYECQWVDADAATLFVAPASLAVEAAYRAAGLEVAGHEPPDSLATELAFVRHLAQAEASGGVSGDPAPRRAFVAEHLDRWVERFCAAVDRATEHGVYAAFARVTAAVAASGRLAA